MKKYILLILSVCCIVSIHAKDNPTLYVSMSSSRIHFGEVLTCTASVSSDAWKIENQEWYLDGEKLGTNYGAPFQLEMLISGFIKSGAHTIKGLAICRKGRKIINITQERSFYVEDSQQQGNHNIFSLTVSSNNVSIGDKINIWASSRFMDYTISFVNLYFGSQNIGFLNAQPFQYNLNIGNGVRPGKYKVQAMIIGYRGNILRTEQAAVYVDVKGESPAPSKSGLTKPLTISGHVYDTDGDMIGVTVSVVGADGDKRTITDMYGNYKLTIPAKATKLRFSYMGYRTSEMNLYDGMSTRLDVKMLSK